MIKTADFVEQYKKGKVSAATLVKMAAFRDELEKGLKDGKISGLIKQALSPAFENTAKSVFDYSWKAPAAPVSTNIFGRLAKGFGTVMSGSEANKAMGFAVAGMALATFMEILKGLEGKIIDWTTDLRKPKMFEDMLEVHPDLRELPLDRVKLYFESLIHFSPVLAENPLAAGAYIKQVMKYDHVAQGPLPETVQLVSTIEKTRRDAQSKSRPSSYVQSVFNPLSKGFGVNGGDDY